MSHSSENDHRPKILPESKERKIVRGLLCPSFAPTEPFGVIFATLGSPEQPAYTPLSAPVPVTREHFNLHAPSHPSVFLRIAAPCIQGRCNNFHEGRCNFGEKVAKAASPSRLLTECSIRPRCRWWWEQGSEACKRCSYVRAKDEVRVGALTFLEPGGGTRND